MLHPLFTLCLRFDETLNSYFQHLHLSHISTPFATIMHQRVNILPAFLQERTLSTCSYLVVTMVAFLRRLPPPTPLPSVPPPPDFIKQGVFVVGQPRFLRTARQLHWSAPLLNEAPQKRAGSGQKEAVWAAAGSDRRAATRPPGALRCVSVNTVYPSTRGSWLSPGAPRVNEVDAALLHLEGRTHGRGGR